MILPYKGDIIQGAKDNNTYKDEESCPITTGAKLTLFYLFLKFNIYRDSDEIIKELVK